jgi:hypothetical protein
VEPIHTGKLYIFLEYENPVNGLLVVSLISLNGGANPHWKTLYFLE